MCGPRTSTLPERATNKRPAEDMPHDEPLAHGRLPGETEPACQKLYMELHRKYIVGLQEKRNTFGIAHAPCPRPARSAARARCCRPAPAGTGRRALTASGRR